MPTVNYPEASEYLATGVANPFATEWVPAPKYRGNQNLYASPISNSVQWWNFTVDVIGEVYFPDNLPPVPLDDVAALKNFVRNSGRMSSFLKVELEYPMGNSQIRRVRFDVGAGIDIFVPPTWSVQATLLVPDPDSIPARLPISFINGVDFASLIVATARCIYAPVGRSIGTYTQCYFVDPQQASFNDIRRSGATSVQVYSNEPLDTANLAFCYDRAPVPDNQELGNFGTGSANPGNSETPPSRWPGSSNCLFYVPLPAPPGGQTVCVVQELEI